MAEVVFEFGEIKNVWVQIEERDAGEITVDSQTFDVVDDGDSIVQALGNASVANNGTSLVQVYGLVTATAAGGFADNTTYKVRFTIAIGAETYKAYMPMRVGEQRL